MSEAEEQELNTLSAAQGGPPLTTPQSARALARIDELLYFVPLARAALFVFFHRCLWMSGVAFSIWFTIILSMFFYFSYLLSYLIMSAAWDKPGHSNFRSRTLDFR